MIVENAMKTRGYNPEEADFIYITKFIPKDKDRALDINSIRINANIRDRDKAFKLIEMAKENGILVIEENGKYYIGSQK